VDRLKDTGSTPVASSFFMMARRAIFGFLAFGVLFAGGRAMAQAKVEDVYRENCASCHGAELDGGSGGALNEGIWKYGASDVEIAASISAGIPDAGMPAFENKYAVRAVVVVLPLVPVMEIMGFRI